MASGSEQNKLAIIMTVYNRKEKTMACLESISKQRDIPSFDVYICDDGSTDGTALDVKKKYNNVTIVKGDGGLFWTRGMAKAMKAAVDCGYDYYLMVNDDVVFFDDMWTLVYAATQGKSNVGVSGCTKSRKDGTLTYSGAKFFHNNGKRYVGEKIAPRKGEYEECDVANWNCFLIDKYVVEGIGLIDETYEHSFGDFDYSLRMRKADMRIYLTEGYVGYCENNSTDNTYKDKTLGRRVRVKKILSPNGLPVHSWFTFTFRHYGKGALRNFIVPYVKFAFSLIR